MGAEEDQKSNTAFSIAGPAIIVCNNDMQPEENISLKEVLLQNDSNSKISKKEVSSRLNAVEGVKSNSEIGSTQITTPTKSRKIKLSRTFALAKVDTQITSEHQSDESPVSATSNLICFTNDCQKSNEQDISLKRKLEGIEENLNSKHQKIEVTEELISRTVASSATKHPRITSPVYVEESHQADRLHTSVKGSKELMLENVAASSSKHPLITAPVQSKESIPSDKLQLSDVRSCTSCNKKSLAKREFFTHIMSKGHQRKSN